MDKSITAVLLITAFAGLLAMASALQRPASLRCLTIAVAIISIDLCLTLFTPKVSPILGIALRWNWTGKIASIFFSVAILVAASKLRSEIGLTTRQAAGSLKWSIGLTAMSVALVAWLTWPEPAAPFKTETLLYQLLMPTLAEELMYRGILLGLLYRAWPKGLNLVGISLGWAPIICTALFGIIHGIAWRDGLQFELVGFLYATVVGAILMFIRCRSGSLLYPMILHSLLNVVSHGIPMLR